MLRPLCVLFVSLCCTPLTAQFDDHVGIGFFGSAYSLDSRTGDFGNLASTGFPNPGGMTSDGAGTYWAAVNIRDIVELDPRTGFSTFVDDTTTNTIRGIAHSVGTTLYVIADGGFGNNDRLYTYDITTDTTTLIGNSNHERIEGVAFSGGVLYVWDMTDGLCTMNTATGATTDVSAVNGGTVEIQSLDFDANGDLHGAGFAFFSIDVATGAFTKVGSDFPGIDFKALAYHDYTPNECLTLSTTPLVGGAAATFTVTGAPNGSDIAVLYSLFGGPTVVNQAGWCATLGIGNVTPANLVAFGSVAGGALNEVVNVPGGASGLLVFFQAMQGGTCPGECVSNVLAEVIG